MNEPTIETETITNAAAECCSEVNDYVRKNPAAAVLIAIGAGVVIGVLVRAMRPAPTPRERIAQMLEDVECRLRRAAGPVLSKAGKLASEGVEVFQDGVHSSEAWLQRLVRKLRGLFS